MSSAELSVLGLLPMVEPTVFSLKKLIGKRKARAYTTADLKQAKEESLQLLVGSSSLSYFPSGQPRLDLPDGGFRSLSISHNSDFLALLTAPFSLSLGVDIESYRDSIVALAPRFLSKEECLVAEQFLHRSPLPQALAKKICYTQMWCAKEAAYKALARYHAEVDFRRFYCIQYLTPHVARLTYTAQADTTLSIHFYIHPLYCLAYTSIPTPLLNQC